jgi:hypothetical protein
MPKLYIEVSGGVVSGVYSNASTEVVLVDHDDIYSENESDVKRIEQFQHDISGPDFTELTIN